MAPIGHLHGGRLELEADDAVIAEERYVEMGDVRVREKDESVVPRDEPNAGVDSVELEDVQPLGLERHDLDAHTEPFVLAAELPHPLLELFPEERLVEHRERP